MKSARLRGLTRLSILLLPLLGVGACVSARPIVTIPSACSTLIPDGWRSPVPGADLYPETPTAGDLVAFGDAQTAALDKANGRTSDAITIVERCEARDKASVAEITKPWWKLW